MFNYIATEFSPYLTNVVEAVNKQYSTNVSYQVVANGIRKRITHTVFAEGELNGVLTLYIFVFSSVTKIKSRGSKPLDVNGFQVTVHQNQLGDE